MPRTRYLPVKTWRTEFQLPAYFLGAVETTPHQESLAKYCPAVYCSNVGTVDSGSASESFFRCRWPSKKPTYSSRPSRKPSPADRLVSVCYFSGQQKSLICSVMTSLD